MPKNFGLEKNDRRKFSPSVRAGLKALSILTDRILLHRTGFLAGSHENYGCFTAEQSFEVDFSTSWFGFNFLVIQFSVWVQCSEFVGRKRSFKLAVAFVWLSQPDQFVGQFDQFRLALFPRGRHSAPWINFQLHRWSVPENRLTIIVESTWTIASSMSVR